MAGKCLFASNENLPLWHYGLDQRSVGGSHLAQTAFPFPARFKAGVKDAEDFAAERPQPKITRDETAAIVNEDQWSTRCLAGLDQRRVRV